MEGGSAINDPLPVWHQRGVDLLLGARCNQQSHDRWCPWAWISPPTREWWPCPFPNLQFWIMAKFGMKSFTHTPGSSGITGYIKFITKVVKHSLNIRSWLHLGMFDPLFEKIVKINFLQGKSGNFNICLQYQGKIREFENRKIYRDICIWTPLVMVCSASGRRWGGLHSPAVACWASDDWVASSNPLRGKFHH